jgi:nucleotide-binding universal stress UspA family protein
MAVESFLAAREPAIPARVLVRTGDPRQAILNAAVQQDCDLLALGTHGRTGLAHVFLGSVAEGVLRIARRDVVVARSARPVVEPP